MQLLPSNSVESRLLRTKGTRSRTKTNFLAMNSTRISPLQTRDPSHSRPKVSKTNAKRSSERNPGKRAACTERFPERTALNRVLHAFLSSCRLLGNRAVEWRLVPAVLARISPRRSSSERPGGSRGLVAAADISREKSPESLTVEKRRSSR